MFRLVVLSALVAFAYSQECCSIEDRKEVLNLWESVWSAEFTGRRVAIAQEVFNRLFEIAPESKALFGRVNVDKPDSPEFRSHVIRVTNGLDTVFNLATDTDSLNNQLAHLSTQHNKYDGMRNAYFGNFRQAFAEILPQAIPCFNAAAWNRCLKAMQEKIGVGLPA